MTTGGAGNIAIVKFAVPVPPGFVALILATDVPELVTVPEIKPVAVSVLNPPGRPVAP